MAMRIVGGQWRGRRLHTPQGDSIRPTSDKVRAALFNILDHRYGAPYKEQDVLDCYCGTGALGLEALSRGARHAQFVDTQASALTLVRATLESVNAIAQATLTRADARSARLPPYSIIFADPPYDADITAFLATISLQKGGLLILEQGLSLPSLPPRLTLLEQRHYGKTQLLFLTTTEQPFNIL
jgi:16S rRNA (guanine966-N2)-methyltransferase